jgi:hypothetical protein
MPEPNEKQYIERAIVRAPSANRDRHLRTNLDPKTLATAYAPQLVAGGAVLGVIVGFGLPKVFRKLITWGVPLAIVAVTVKNVRERNGQGELMGLS